MKRCAHTQGIHRDEQSLGHGGVSTVEPIKVGKKKVDGRGPSLRAPGGPRSGMEMGIPSQTAAGSFIIPGKDQNMGAQGTHRHPKSHYISVT